METVEVVIRIPKEQLERLQRIISIGTWGLMNLNSEEIAILSGTVLPKGHSRLIEGDKLIDKIKPLISNKVIMEAIDTIITFSPTVIEADKGGE